MRCPRLNCAQELALRPCHRHRASAFGACADIRITMGSAGLPSPVRSASRRFDVQRATRIFGGREALPLSNIN